LEKYPSGQLAGSLLYGTHGFGAEVDRVICPSTVTGRCCAAGFVRIGAFPKRNSRSTSGSSRLYITSASEARRCCLHSLSYWSRKTPESNKSVVPLCSLTQDLCPPRDHPRRACAGQSCGAVAMAVDPSARDPCPACLCAWRYRCITCPPNFLLSFVTPVRYTYARTAVPIPTPSAVRRIGLGRVGNDL
jgi:hypothetical protein